MDIKRTIYDSLLTWKDSKQRKPLILRRARQVSKTTIVNRFAQLFWWWGWSIRVWIVRCERQHETQASKKQIKPKRNAWLHNEFHWI